MSFRVVLFAYRKPTISPEAFKHHYETIHVPLVQTMTGSLFPLSHTRRYISRPVDAAADKDGESTYTAELISGNAKNIEYDAITEMTFESRDVFNKFAGLLNEPDNAARIQEDCALYLDMTKPPTMVVLGDVCEHLRGEAQN